MHNVIIRPVEKDDIESLLLYSKDLNEQHGWSIPFNKEWKRKYFYNCLTNDDIYFSCAIDKEKIVGYVLVQYIDQAHIGAYKLRIMELFVQKCHRRKGIASKLIDFSTNTPGKEKPSSIETEVAKANGPSLSLFNKLGFTTKSIILWK